MDLILCLIGILSSERKKQRKILLIKETNKQVEGLVEFVYF